MELIRTSRRYMNMFGILTTILAASSLGGTLGGAVATVIGGSVEAGIAYGTLGGAGLGTVIAVAEESETSAKESMA